MVSCKLIVLLFAAFIALAAAQEYDYQAGEGDGEGEGAYDEGPGQEGGMEGGDQGGFEGAMEGGMEGGFDGAGMDGGAEGGDEGFSAAGGQEGSYNPELQGSTAAFTSRLLNMNGGAVYPYVAAASANKKVTIKAPKASPKHRKFTLYRRLDNPKRPELSERAIGRPVKTYVKTDLIGNVRWGVQHSVGSEYR